MHKNQELELYLATSRDQRIEDLQSQNRRLEKEKKALLAVSHAQESRINSYSRQNTRLTEQLQVVSKDRKALLQRGQQLASNNENLKLENRWLKNRNGALEKQAFFNSPPNALSFSEAMVASEATLSTLARDISTFFSDIEQELSALTSRR